MSDVLGPDAGDRDDRELCRLDYLAGVKPRQLAERYDVPIRRVRSWITAGKWKDQRGQVRATVDAELPGAVAEGKLDAAREHAGRHLSVWDSILDRARELLAETEYVVGGMSGAIVLDEHGQPLKRRIVRTAGHLRDLSAAIKAATEGQRLALGLPDPKPVDPSNHANGAPAGVIEIPAMDAPPVPPDEPEDVEP